MALIDRLAGFGDPETTVKLSVAAFWALLYEMAKGKVTKTQIENYFGLDAGEKSELQWLINRYNAQPTSAAKASFVELMMVIFSLCEARVPGYTTNADIVDRINAI
jgi:hypothetical protein